MNIDALMAGIYTEMRQTKIQERAPGAEQIPVRLIGGDTPPLLIWDHRQ